LGGVRAGKGVATKEIDERATGPCRAPGKSYKIPCGIDGMPAETISKKPYDFRGLEQLSKEGTPRE